MQTFIFDTLEIFSPLFGLLKFMLVKPLRHSSIFSNFKFVAWEITDLIHCDFLMTLHDIILYLQQVATYQIKLLYNPLAVLKYFNIFYIRFMVPSK